MEKSLINFVQIDLIDTIYLDQPVGTIHYINTYYLRYTESYMHKYIIIKIINIIDFCKIQLHTQLGAWTEQCTILSSRI